MKALRVIGESIGDLWGEIVQLLLMNVVTVLLLFPVVTFPPALAGLWYVAGIVSEGRMIYWTDYFEGFKRYFWKAWGLFLIAILVLALILLNILFYVPGSNVPFDMGEGLVLFLRRFFIVVGIVWLMYWIYPLAMLFELEKPQIKLALRNSLVLFMRNPGFTLVIAVFFTILAVVSTLLGGLLWVLLTPALMAIVCRKAVNLLLAPHREKVKVEQAVEGQELEEMSP